MNNPNIFNYLDANINSFNEDNMPDNKYYVLQCAISKNNKIKTVFNCIFVYFTKLCIHSVIALFSHYNYNRYKNSDETEKANILVNILYQLYQPDIDLTGNIVNIDKPGIHFQKDTLKEMVVEKIINNEPLNDEFLEFLNNKKNSIF